MKSRVTPASSPVARWLFCALASIILTGCETYHEERLDIGKSGADFDARRLDSPEALAWLQDGVTPSSTQANADLRVLNLDQLSKIALLYHPDLAAARAHLAAVTAAQTTAGESPNPSVGFSPSYATKAAGANPWTLGWTFDIPIETANKRGIRIAQSNALTQAARAEIAETAWHIRGHVRDALTEYLLTLREAEVYRQEVENRKRYAEALDLRVQAGEASRPESTIAKLDFMSAQQGWLSTQGRVKEARTHLADAVGVPVAGLGEIEFQWPGIFAVEALPPHQVAALRTAALTHRLDLYRSLYEYDAAESALELEIAKQYPDLHISPGYTFDQGQNKWELGAGIELPVFNQNQGAIAEARARRAEQAARVYALQAQAIGQLESAEARYQAAYEQWNSASEQFRTVQQQVDAARRAFDAGELDRPTLTASEVQRDFAARLQIDALRKAREAYGALEDAVQRPLDELDAKSPMRVSRP